MRGMSKARLGTAVIALAIGIVGAIVLIVVVRLGASLQPVSAHELHGVWGPRGSQGASLELLADGTAVASDLRYRDDSSISGLGTWSLEDGSRYVLLVIDDADDGSREPRALHLDAERDGFAIVLVDYIGDPDSYNRRILDRRER